MTRLPAMNDTGARRARPARMARAVLAGGLVFGVGAMSTLAAWTDQTAVAGTLSTSTFQVESTATPGDPTSWAPHGDAASALQFSASGMTPGSERYQGTALRTAPGSLGGTAVVQAAQVTSSGTGTADLGAALRYRVIVSPTCDASAFTTRATYLVGSAAAPQPLTTGQNGTATATLKAASATAPGAPLPLCFEISLPEDAPNSLQGTTATATWTIVSESVTT